MVVSASSPSVKAEYCLCLFSIASYLSISGGQFQLENDLSRSSLISKKFKDIDSGHSARTQLYLELAMDDLNIDEGFYWA